MPRDKIAHVKEQINTISSRLDPRNKGDYIMVRCPWHSGGNERTPSCSISLTRPNVPVGVFNCLACHEKGSWNKFAEKTNLKSFRAADQINDVFSFSVNRISHKPKSFVEDYESQPLWPKDQKWRTITPYIMRMYEGVTPSNPVFEDDFIYFPVLVNKKHLGGIYARKIVSKKTKEAGLPSYINTSGPWTKEALFGYDIAKKQKGPLSIMEGPRDTMKTRQVGGRAVGLCGAYISDRKIALIEALDPPAIILLTDPDEAGNKARATLRKRLSHFPLFEYDFPENKDPACFTEKSYRKMLVKLGLRKE